MSTTNELHKLANAMWHYNLRGRIELAQMKRAMGLRLNRNEQRALNWKEMESGTEYKNWEWSNG